MKVLRRSDDELVIEERAWLLRAFGGVFAGIGLLVLLVPHYPGFSGYSLGGLSFLLGASFILLPRVTTITFDRGRGTVQLDRVGLVLPEDHRSAALLQVRGVKIDSGRDDNDRTYRIMLEITGEDPMPFTTYFTSGKAGKQDVADAVRGWLAKQ